MHLGFCEMVVGFDISPVRLCIALAFFTVTSGSVYRLRSDSHGVTPITRMVDGENSKGMNLPAEFLQHTSFSRQRRSAKEFGDPKQKIASEYEFQKDDDYVGFIHWSGKNSKVR